MRLFIYHNKQIKQGKQEQSHWGKALCEQVLLLLLLLCVCTHTHNTHTYAYLLVLASGEFVVPISFRMGLGLHFSEVQLLGLRHQLTEFLKVSSLSIFTI